jgi:nickel transport protein
MPNRRCVRSSRSPGTAKLLRTTIAEAPDARESLWSVKFGKDLTGSGAPWDKVLGHELEIVPLSDPLTVKPGQKLHLRVLFSGQPLAGEIERGDGLTVVPEADIPRFTTDSDGVAEVPVVKSGPMQLVIDHSVSPSATPALAKVDMFNATLWYMLPR